MVSGNEKEYKDRYHEGIRKNKGILKKNENGEGDEETTAAAGDESSSTMHGVDAVNNSHSTSTKLKRREKSQNDLSCVSFADDEERVSTCIPNVYVGRGNQSKGNHKSAGAGILKKRENADGSYIPATVGLSHSVSFEGDYHSCWSPKRMGRGQGLTKRVDCRGTGEGEGFSDEAGPGGVISSKGSSFDESVASQQSLISVWSNAAGTATIKNVVYLSTFSILGAVLRVMLGLVFGGACDKEGYGWMNGVYFCVTDDEGALFTDLPANMAGSFLMGLLSMKCLNLKDHILLGLKTGFCGSLTTFASWNTQMVVMFFNGEAPSALFGYVIGLELALTSYRIGVSWSEAIDRFVSGGERQFHQSLFKPSQTLAKCVGNIFVVEPTPSGLDQDQGKEQNDHRTLDMEIIDSENVVDKFKDWISKGFQVDDQDEEQSQEDAIENKVVPSNHDSTKKEVSASNSKSDARRKKVFGGIKSSLWMLTIVVLEALPIALSIFLFVLFLWFDNTAWPHRLFFEKMWMTCALSPPGCLIRWKLSKLLNGKKMSKVFPLGTITANLIGSIASIVAIGISTRMELRSNLSPLVSVLLSAVKTGFAGCLSTVSTFVSEIVKISSKRNQKYTVHNNGYWYGYSSLILSSIVASIIYGALVHSNI